MQLKPTDTEIRNLALAETAPENYPRFSALALGPVVTLLLLLALVLVSIPWSLARVALRRRA